MLRTPYFHDFVSRNVNFKGAWLWKGVNCEHTHGGTHLSSMPTPPMIRIKPFAAVKLHSAHIQLTTGAVITAKPNNEIPHRTPLSCEPPGCDPPSPPHVGPPQIPLLNHTRCQGPLPDPAARPPQSDRAVGPAQPDPALNAIEPQTPATVRPPAVGPCYQNFHSRALLSVVRPAVYASTHWVPRVQN
jgi:hypothetical protein